MGKQPLFSICIPTYNRCKLLEGNLSTIVQLEGFDDDIEIVISDNCSTDDTQKIGEYYASKYSNIKYYRNDKNEKDSNFCLALDRASGLYVKLFNDNVKILPHGLLYFKEKVNKHIDDKTALFFTNDYVYTYPHEKQYICDSFDDFVKYLSTFVTKISCFGAWKEDWDLVTDRLKYTEYMLNQDDWSYQILANKGNCILYNEKYYGSLNISLGKRNGYNWFEVHLDNYYKIMKPYVDNGFITPETLKQDKINLFKHFIPEIKKTFCYPYIYRDNWQFDTSKSLGYFFKYYKEFPGFYIILFTYPLWGSVLFLYRSVYLAIREVLKLIGMKNVIQNILFKS